MLNSNICAMVINRIKTFQERSPLRARLLSGGMWVVGGKSLITLLAMVINGLLARLLSPDDMGTYVFVLSLVTSASVIAQLGLGLTIVRLIASFLGAGNLAMMRQFVIKAVQWAVIGALGTALVFGLAGERLGVRPDVVWLAAGWVIILAWQQLLADFMRGFHDMGAAVALKGARIGGAIASVIAALLLFGVWVTLRYIELKTAIVLLMVGGIVSVLWAGRHLRDKVVSHIKDVEFEKPHPALRILPMSLPILVDNMAALLINQSSIWTLHAFLSSTDVALYGTAARLVSLMNIQLTIVNIVLAPSIAELYARGEIKKLERLQRRVATLASMPALAVILAFAVVGEGILAFVYSDFYRAGASVLLVLAVGCLVGVLTGSCGTTLIMTGHQTTIMMISIVSGLLTVGAARLLIVPFGLVGAACATAFGVVLKNILMLVSARRLVGIWTCATVRWK